MSSDSATPDRDVFVNVIVETVRKHGSNAVEACTAIAADHNYPLNAAALATLLALIYLDNMVQVTHLLGGLAREDGTLIEETDITPLFDEPRVAQVIASWAYTPRELKDEKEMNVSTELIRFAMSYSSFSCLPALLGDMRVAERMSLAEYRRFTDALQQRLIGIMNGAGRVPMFIDNSKLELLSQVLENAGLATLRETLLLFSTHRERALYKALEDDPDNAEASVLSESEKSRIASEVQRDECRELLASVSQLERESAEFLKMVTNSTKTMLKRAAREQAKERALREAARERALVELQSKADPDADIDDKLLASAQMPEPADEFDAATAFTQLDETDLHFQDQMAEYKKHAAKTLADQTLCYAQLIATLRGYVINMKAEATSIRETLAALEAQVSTARTAEEADTLAQLRREIQEINYDDE